MTHTMELSIARPSWYNGDQWATVSNCFMQVLERKFGLLPNYEVQCGWLLGSFLTDEEVRLLTLHVLGMTLPDRCADVAQLMIVGDGACPHCGSNARKEIWGGYTRDEEGGGFAVLGWTCENCGTEDYR